MGGKEPHINGIQRINNHIHKTRKIRLSGGSVLTVIEEYQNQNRWRDWARYLDKLPLSFDKTVIDLGCSIGVVTNQLAQKSLKAIGYDIDEMLLNEAKQNRKQNTEFINADFLTIDTGKFGMCDGIWMSFALAYVKEPDDFISSWVKCLNNDGWFAIADIDGFFSCHLPKNNKFAEEIDTFEKASETNKGYNFRIGRHIKALLEQNGLDIIVDENDWYDRELNFSGAAEAEILKNWDARLARMVSLKNYFGERYQDFCKEFLNALTLETHASHGGVRYYVGIKKAKS
jgi:SAM-dependent methyltransferase